MRTRVLAGSLGWALRGAVRHDVRARHARSAARSRAARRRARGALAERVDPNQAEPDGTTPLHWAVHNNDVDLVAKLIAAGANVNTANDYGATPMSEAAVTANVDVLKALLAAGADVESANADGQTALMVVARTRQRRGRGAPDRPWRERQRSRGAQGPDGADVGRRAESQPAMVPVLLKHGADAEARSNLNEWERQVTAEPRQKNLLSGRLHAAVVRRAPGLPRLREGAASAPAPPSIARIRTA